MNVCPDIIQCQHASDLFWVSNIFTENNINKAACECGFQSLHSHRLGVILLPGFPTVDQCERAFSRDCASQGAEVIIAGQTVSALGRTTANTVFGEITLCDRKMSKVDLQSNSSKRNLRSCLWAQPSDCQTLMCSVLLVHLKQVLFNDPEFLRARGESSFIVKHLLEARCAFSGHLVTT